MLASLDQAGLSRKKPDGVESTPSGRARATLLATVLPARRSSITRQNRKASRVPAVWPCAFTGVNVPTITYGPLLTVAAENGWMSNCGYFSRASATRRSPICRVAADCSPVTPFTSGSITTTWRGPPGWPLTGAVENTASATFSTASGYGTGCIGGGTGGGATAATGGFWPVCVQPADNAMTAPARQPRRVSPLRSGAGSGPALGPQRREFRIGQRLPHLSPADDI